MKKPISQALRWGVTPIVAMCLSYLLVGQLLARSEPDPLTLEELREATQLRLFSNELVLLVDEFLVKERVTEPAGRASYEKWVRRSFHPKVNDLRQRLVRSDLSSRAHTALLAAADRTAAMGGRPQDARLQESAKSAVLEALAKSESHITQMGADKRVTPRPATPSFTKR